MRLFVFRHAKAALGDERTRDFDRPLKERGRADAAAIGQYLQGRGVGFDLVLASPAARVRQTIESVEETYGQSLDPDFRESLYNASTAALLRELQSVGESARNVLLVGHNPGLHELVFYLAETDSRDKVADFPTGALAVLEIPGGWDALRSDSCRLADFIRPRDLPAR